MFDMSTLSIPGISYYDRTAIIFNILPGCLGGISELMDGRAFGQSSVYMRDVKTCMFSVNSVSLFPCSTKVTLLSNNPPISWIQTTKFSNPLLSFSDSLVGKV